MLRSYLSVAARVLRKHPLYSAIKIVGLAIGLAAFFLIGAFVRFELSFDRFHEKAERIYRIVKEDDGNFYLGSNRFAVTPAPLQDALIAELPDVETATQIDNVEALLSVGENGFFEDGLFATSTFFDVFSFRMLRGDGRQALDEPGSILLTPELATRLFGEQDPVGQVVDFAYYSTRLDLTVAGLVDAPPPNAHFDYDYLVSMRAHASHSRNREEDRWGSNSWYTYAVLRPGADPRAFNLAAGELGHRHLSELEWYRENDHRTTFYAQALPDIHLRSHINFEIGPTGDMRYVVLFGLIALAILFTASVNYTNLATARAATRAREIGVRKASGAFRSQLMGQFLSESVLLSAAGVVVALGVVVLVRPFFNGLVQREIPPEYLLDGWAIGVGAAAGLVAGLLSGIYPAMVLARMEPAKVLKGKATERRRTTLRNGLVTAQFAVGVMLVFGSIVVTRQIAYMGAADTGLARDQILSVRVRDDGVEQQSDAVLAEIRAIPGVLNLAVSRHVPTRVTNQNGVDDWTGHQEGQEASIYTTTGDYAYLELLGLELVEGRNFSEEFGDDASKLIINETARDAFGWDSAVGKFIDFGDDDTVIGVVRDYHFHDFRQEIAPLAIWLDPAEFGRILVKVAPERTPQTVAAVGDVMARFSPAFPYEYDFLDDAYDSMYASDRRLASIFNSFTAVALAIACLGLFGLAAFMVQVRTKEIGVRKVLGARSDQIVGLMLRDLAQPVAIAVLIGGPIAWWGMNRWLSAFAYRIEPGLGAALVTLAAVLLVAIVTIGWQAWRAAGSDPVSALRYE